VNTSRWAVHALLASVIFCAAGCGDLPGPLVLATRQNGALYAMAARVYTSRATVGDAKVRGLYLTGWTVGGSDRLRHYIALAKTTEINAYVIDVKDSDGYVGYAPDVPAVREAGAWLRKYNPDKVVPSLHENGIRAVGRVVCFKDPVLSSKRPEWAILDAKGKPWKDRDHKTWLNPYARDSWKYLMAVAREAVAKGFDEIQFDYVRFPSDGPKKAMQFGDTRGQTKYDLVGEFLAYARRELPGVVLSADVFGIICESREDTEDIGQYLERIGGDVDYLSPMVYPSHYALGQVINGARYATPDLEPYKVVYNSLAKAKRRIAATPEFRANMRPYLQDFTASWLGKGRYRAYGVDEVRGQIKAVYDAGYDQWILWNARNQYSEAALERKAKP
jgi:hypothetical protein